MIYLRSSRVETIICFRFEFVSERLSGSNCPNVSMFLFGSEVSNPNSPEILKRFSHWVFAVVPRLDELQDLDGH